MAVLLCRTTIISGVFLFSVILKEAKSGSSFIPGMGFFVRRLVQTITNNMPKKLQILVVFLACFLLDLGEYGSGL